MLINLDKLAATASQKMVALSPEAEKLERLATKTLGVLQGQGVYACMVFLLSRGSEEQTSAKVIRGQLFALLKELPAFSQNADVPSADSDASQALGFFSRELLDEAQLDSLLLVRDLYEQTLIYARYHAKSAGA